MTHILSPMQRIVLEAVAFDPRTYVAWNATDAYPYTLLSRIQRRRRDASDRAVRTVLRSCVDRGYLDPHQSRDAWKLTQTGSEVLYGA